MDRLEMIEKLRERADVSYEEAKAALDQANDDLLEAIVILEQQGKIRERTAAENSGGDSSKGKAKNAFGSIGAALSRAWNFLIHTAFHVTHNDREIFVMPSLVFALLLLCCFYTILPVMLIALFFNVRYHFSGSEGADKAADKANDVLSKAGDIADGVKNAAETVTAGSEADE